MYNYVHNCLLQAERSREQVREAAKYIAIAQDREATSLSVENQIRGFETAIEPDISSDKDFIVKQDVLDACDRMMGLNQITTADSVGLLPTRRAYPKVGVTG